jgi:cytochrome c-type biogenesis protein CcmH
MGGGALDAPPCHPEAEGRGVFRDAGRIPRCARDDTNGLRRTLSVLILSLLISLPCLAVEPSEMLSDPALEARARALGRELRCVVCQNESVDDSPAEVAHDIRRAVRERLVAGDTDRQVLDYMVARYGDYVLLKPPFKTRTLVLWLGTPAVLLLGVIGLWFVARRRSAVLAPVPLSDAERARLDALPDGKNDVISSEARDP